jgi:predicted RNase H-like nuclease (RuvC/YqgF family)
MDENEAL